jgi:hypothetical protein
MSTCYAHIAQQGESRYVEAALANAPAWARESVNRARVLRGLPPILTAVAQSEIAQATARARAAAEAAEAARYRLPTAHRAPPARSTPQAPACGPIVTRVLMVAAYGEAPAHAVRGTLPETIAFDAFGTAESLNRWGGWSLLRGHEGPKLAIAGQRLRAHDSDSGLIVEWTPDLTLEWNREAVRAIEAGRNAVSVGMQIAERRVSRLPDPVSMIRQARLLDVALLINGETPAYPGARAKVFRARRDDHAELRKNIADVIEHARWHSRPRY